MKLASLLLSTLLILASCAKEQPEEQTQTPQIPETPDVQEPVDYGDGSKERPFVIDTPFARIDTEHRQNISKHFFSKLNGQVFILSTNEEIDSKHVGIMKDKIAVTYMLENADNTRTSVSRNAYFEE